MNFIRALSLAAALGCTTPALAQAQDNAPAGMATAPILLSEAELAMTRGGQTIVVNNQTLGAIVSGNVMGDSVAGDITLSDDALSNFAGVGNFVINTGAQNNLQAGMTLTVTVNQ